MRVESKFTRSGGKIFLAEKAAKQRLREGGVGNGECWWEWNVAMEGTASDKDKAVKCGQGVTVTYPLTRLSNIWLWKYQGIIKREIVSSLLEVLADKPPAGKILFLT